MSGFVVLDCAESGKRSDAAVTQEQPSASDSSATTLHSLEIKSPSHSGLFERIGGDKDEIEDVEGGPQGYRNTNLCSFYFSYVPESCSTLLPPAAAGFLCYKLSGLCYLVLNESRHGDLCCLQRYSTWNASYSEAALHVQLHPLFY